MSLKLYTVLVLAICASASPSLACQPCGHGPQIVHVLPSRACNQGPQWERMPGEGNRYRYQRYGPPCDPLLTYERQAWSDWPECEGARQLK